MIAEEFFATQFVALGIWVGWLMQPSELWRRGVVLPLTVVAVEQIDAWDVDNSTPVEFLPIASEAMFSRLCRIGLFEEINRACGSLIDNYEGDWLQPDQLPSAAGAVDKLHRRNPGGEIGEFLERLSDLIGQATQAHLPLYFEC